MPDDYIDNLKTFDWERITLELLRYCANLAALKGKKPEQLIGKSQSVEDIVAEAIEAVLTGSRKWNPERGELIPFLKLSVIRSIFSNANKAKENSLLDCLDAYYSDTYDEHGQIGLKKDTNVATQSAEQEIIETHEFQRILAAFNEAIASLNRKEMSDVFECICEGICKPAEIEIMTGIPAVKISEIKRQLANKLGGIYAKL